MSEPAGESVVLVAPAHDAHDGRIRPAAPAGWTAAANVVVGSVARAPRVLIANVEVRIDIVQVVGSGDVVVEGTGGFLIRGAPLCRLAWSRVSFR